jgi:hypothetical protein
MIKSRHASGRNSFYAQDFVLYFICITHCHFFYYLSYSNEMIKDLERLPKKQKLGATHSNFESHVKKEGQS